MRFQNMARDSRVGFQARAVLAMGCQQLDEGDDGRIPHHNRPLVGQGVAPRGNAGRLVAIGYQQPAAIQITVEPEVAGHGEHQSGLADCQLPLTPAWRGEESPENND